MFKKYFGDMGFWRIALKLAFPVAMQNLLTSSFILVDTIMVGQLGDFSLSAVGMAGQFGWFLNMITFGMCSGAAVSYPSIGAQRTLPVYAAPME